MKPELAYFFSLFKMPGHETWRMDISQKVPAPATNVRKFRIDRITGEVRELPKK